MSACCVLSLAAFSGCGSDSDEKSTAPASGGAVGSGGFVGSGGAQSGSGGTTQSVGSGGMPMGGMTGAGGFVAGSGGSVQGAGGMISGGGMTGMGGAPGAGGNLGAGGTTSSASEFTFETATFTVPPGSEVYKCQDFRNPFGQDVAIVESTTHLVSGSHHMFAFLVPNDQLSLFDALVDCPGGGVEFHPYLTTSASEEATTTYPPGVGRVLGAGDGVRLMVHLLNVTPDAQDAFIRYTVRHTDPATLQYRAGSIFLNNIGIRVPPGQSTQRSSYTLPSDIWLMGAASHMHSRGVHFVATANGQTLVDDTAWEDPKMFTFDPALHLTAGTTINWECTYQNETARTLTFGESASSNEMCIFPGEFYNDNGFQITSQQF